MLERFQLFTVLVARAGRCVRKLKDAEMQEFSLKGTHVSCLYYLHAMGALTAKELSEICGEDKANLSRAVEYLEREGYILPSTAQKRYKTPLCLTEKGRQVGRRIDEKIEGILLAASEGLSDEERACFYRSFERIDRNLEKICEGIV